MFDTPPTPSVKSPLSTFTSSVQARFVPSAAGILNVGHLQAPSSEGSGAGVSALFPSTHFPLLLSSGFTIHLADSSLKSGSSHLK